MKRIFPTLVSIILTYLVSSFLAYANDSIPNGLLIAKIELSPALAGVSETKIEAAVNLAAISSKKYYLISREARDSIVQQTKTESSNPSILNIARSLDASRILFIKVNRIENMLRIDLQSVQTDSGNISHYGFGYANLWLRNKENNDILYDPALLVAFQRAFAAAEDSTMFKNAEPGFIVFPAKTLAIGSIYYLENKGPAHWDIFNDKIVGSFEAVETIFDEAKHSDIYVVYDIPSRDSIYANFRLYMVENYTATSSAEIEALLHFSVDSFISGTLTGNGNNINLSLTLYSSAGNSYLPIKTEEGIIKSDSKKEYLSLIRKLTMKLLDIQSKN